MRKSGIKVFVVFIIGITKDVVTRALNVLCMKTIGKSPTPQTHPQHV